MIDTHCHLNFDSFDPDRDSVVDAARAAGVNQIIIPAVDLPTCLEALALASEYAGIFAAVGVHPNSTAAWSPEHLAAVRDYSQQPGVVAIGEIGLDYHWDTSPPAAQKRALEAQLSLARQLELPVIIHNRESDADVIAILESWAADLTPALKERPGVLHSFSGDQNMAERALQAGFYLGFTGPITYKNAEQTRRIAATIPLDRLLVETDAPYLTPVPHRGQRNQPAYIPLIVERLASIKQVALETMASVTTANAARLFKLNQNKNAESS